jgi:hypothetical protein
VSPTPKMPLPWMLNTADGGGDYPVCLVGDRFLVAVPLSAGGHDFQVIIADEIGFTHDGEDWSAWSWSDVEYYIPLDGKRVKPEGDS